MSVNYKQLFDKAFKLHNEGNISEAEKLYKILLEMSPEDFNVLNLYGLLCITKNDYKQAIAFLSKAVVLSKSSYVINNLAKAHLSANDIGNAIKLFKQSITVDPNNDDSYYSMAIAYKKLNNLNLAAQCYEKALEINPNNYNAGYNLIVVYKDLKMYKLAIKYANKCILMNPNSEEIYSLLSYLYECIDEIKLAVKSLEKAVKIQPKQYLYFYNLGVLYSKLNDLDNSIFNYKKVLELKPDSVATLVNLSAIYRKKDINIALDYIMQAKKLSPRAKKVLLNVAQIYKDMNKNNESIEVANEILSFDSKSHEAFSLLAMNYMDLGQYETALKYYEKAIELSPSDYSYLHGKAVALKYLGKTDEFKRLMSIVVENDPKTPEAKITLGMAYLAEKNFDKGMQLYSARNLYTNFTKIFGKKVWKQSEDISGKQVVLYSNCGLGDTIMFARYIPLISEIAKKIILQTDRTLVPILTENYKNIQIIDKSTKITDNFDYAIPVMDIPYVIRKNFSDIPYSEGYILPDPKLVDSISKLDIFNTSLKKVGICIQGNKKIFKNRSLSTELIKPFFENENIRYYSLQVGEAYEQNENLIDLRPYIRDFNDTAAVIGNLDLVISIDSSIVHLSGAMGVKTFLMLPYTPEWRWFNDTDTTPWYKSVKIFKQTKINDWSNVVIRINNCLKEL